MLPPKDPFALRRLLWPDVRFYDKQREIITSVRDNFETVCVAGNMLGKDFVSGFVVLWFFLTHHPCRVITTTVRSDHLRVLWGEMGRFVQTSRFPMLHEDGGPLIVKHLEIQRIYKGKVCPISYVRGMTSQRGEGMAGHHAAHTLCVIDEASGVDDEAYEQAQGWAKKFLVIGNPNPCNNFFRRAVEGGDVH